MAGDNYSIKSQHDIHFSTFTIIDWIDLFTRKVYCDEFVKNVNYCIENKGLEVYGWCIMPSHIHLIARADSNHGLSEIYRDLKKYLSKRFFELINQEKESRRDWLLQSIERAGIRDSRTLKNKVWQESSHHTIIYQNRMDILKQKLNYIHQNPVKAGYVTESHHWNYSSAADYCGLKGMIPLVFID